MKIYTKTGDGGETHVKGRRVSKSDALMQAIGDVDELNSWLGMANSECCCCPIKSDIRSIQHVLFEIGAELAGFHVGNYDEYVEFLEDGIDYYESYLVPLKEFILPGGDPTAAQLYVARSVCRRAERSVVAAIGGGSGIQVYLNRLSDYLFVVARYQNHKSGFSETPWRGV